MTRLLLYFTACFLVCGCGKNRAPQAAPAWHEPWLVDKLAAGAELLGDQALPPGGFHTVSFPTDRPREIGFVVKDGYDVSKSRGQIYMGPEDKPRLAGASVGTSQTFDPVDGKIVVKFENASTVSTRIAIWRK